MGKEKYVYNPHSLKYERVKESLNSKLLRAFGIFCATLLTAVIFTVFINRYFPSFAQRELMKENKMLQTELKALGQEFDKFNKELTHLQEKDAYAHRMVFRMDPIDEGIWKGGKGGHEQYQELKQYKFSGEMMAQLKERVDKLKHQMVVQSYSLDTITHLAKDKANMLASIPSVKPVRSDKLPRKIRLLSGFGRRIHPVYKVPKMHYGIDFTAPRGTPIQATGAGKVIKASRTNGYGNRVVIDHGYGYQTMYAHMHKLKVKVGDKVTRGQQIGTVGSTGISTAPHCHYEVVLKGKKVDPIHYCMDGLSPAEYQDLVEAAGQMNQSFD